MSNIVQRVVVKGKTLSRDDKICNDLKSRLISPLFDRIRSGESSPFSILNKALQNSIPNPYTVNQLPAGHHLLLFPPKQTNDFLPDGTDTVHYPGAPWVRRMWAGGSIDFKSDSNCTHLLLSGGSSRSVGVCRERVLNAELRNNRDNSKLWVDLERVIRFQRYNPAYKYDPETVYPDIIDRRQLVFMEAWPANQPVAKSYRLIKTPDTPDYNISIIPDANLLFLFSALTLNAHRIHLDRDYARSEGYRNIIVHGPLALFLALRVLGLQIGPQDMIKSISYKILVPLFVDEKMTICVKRAVQPTQHTKRTSPNQKWDVWIEGPSGGYALKGSAETGPPDYKLESLNHN